MYTQNVYINPFAQTDISPFLDFFRNSSRDIVLSCKEPSGVNNKCLRLEYSTTLESEGA